MGKAMSLIAAMCAGADSIDGTDLLRSGGLDRLFHGIYAPSTLGSFLRAFTHGYVRQLQATARRFTAHLIGHAGLVPPGEPIVFLDIDSKVKQVYGPDKQGASFGYIHVRGLHFQIVTASTPSSRPVIVATRLRKGSAGSGKGAASLVAEAIRALRGGRDHRDDRGARRLGVLLRQARQGSAHRRGTVLDHRREHQADPRRAADVHPGLIEP